VASVVVALEAVVPLEDGKISCKAT